MRVIRTWEIVFVAVLGAFGFVQFCLFALQIVVEYGVTWSSLWRSKTSKDNSAPPSLVGDKNAEKYIAHAANRGKGDGHHHNHHNHHVAAGAGGGGGIGGAGAGGGGYRRGSAHAPRNPVVAAAAVAAAATFPLQPGVVPRVPVVAAPHVPVLVDSGRDDPNPKPPSDPASPQHATTTAASGHHHNPRDTFQRQASMPNAHASVISVGAPSGVGSGDGAPHAIVSQQNLHVSAAPVASLATPAPGDHSPQHRGSPRAPDAAAAVVVAELPPLAAAAAASASPRNRGFAAAAEPSAITTIVTAPLAGAPAVELSQQQLPAVPPSPSMAQQSLLSGAGGGSAGGGVGASQVAVNITTTPSNRSALLAQARRQASQQRLLMLATVTTTASNPAAQAFAYSGGGGSTSNLFAAQSSATRDGDSGVGMTGLPLHVIPEKRVRHNNGSGRAGGGGGSGGGGGGDASSGDERDGDRRRNHHRLMPGAVVSGNKSDGDHTDGDASDGGGGGGGNASDQPVGTDGLGSIGGIRERTGTATGSVLSAHPPAALSIPSPMAGNVSAVAGATSAFGYASPSPKAPSPMQQQQHSGHSPLLSGGGGGGNSLVQHAGTTALPTAANSVIGVQPPSPSDLNSTQRVGARGAGGVASPTAALSPPLFVRPRLPGKEASPKAGTHAGATLQVTIASPTAHHAHAHRRNSMPQQQVQPQQPPAEAVKVREPVKVKVDRYSLPWWFHRIGLFIAFLQLIGYVDPNHSFDILPRAMQYVVSSLVIGAIMMAGSIWVWFAVSLLYRDAHETAPRSLLYALVAIPLFYITAIDILSIPALLATNHYVWDIPNAVGFLLTVCSYGVILPVTYFRVRATLMRFVDSVTKAGRAGPPSGNSGDKPKTTPTNGGGNSGAAGAAATASAPASGAADSSHASSGQQHGQGQGQGRPLFDLSHIHRGLRNLSRFVFVLMVLDLAAIIGTGFMAIDHIMTSIRDPTGPPPPDDAELPVGNSVLIALIQIVNWAILWYSWNPVSGRSTSVTAMRVQTVTRPLPPSPASPLELTQSKQPPSPFTDAEKP